MQNMHVCNFESFDAIDGRSVSKNSKIFEDSFEPSLKYSKGALGCALSHKKIWELASNTDCAVTVCEDDTILHSDFIIEQKRIIEELIDWDLILWGWNFNALFLAEMVPKLSPCFMKFDQNSMRINWKTFISEPIKPVTLTLISAFGSPCYSMSSKGARKFLQRCFPIKNFEYRIPGFNIDFPNYGIDIAMNTVYPVTASFVAFPPLAITLNNQERSTVQ